MKKPESSSLTSENIVAFLADIFDRRGGEEYLGEPVTMAQHMLQGAHFAEKAGEPEVIVVSSLLHDIGHFTSEFGTFSMDDIKDKYHEATGAQVLELGPVNASIHKINEHVRVSDLDRLSEIYQGILAKLLG